MTGLKQHLKSRHFYGKAWLDEEAGVVTFPLWNLSGQLVGYQKYNFGADKKAKNNPREGRYFTYAKDRLAVWGLESWGLSPGLVFVTEGVFDACRLHNLGLTSVAVLSNDNLQAKTWLRSCGRYVVAVCDNDQAGKKLAKFGHAALFVQDGKDLGDLHFEQVKDLVKDFYFW